MTETPQPRKSYGLPLAVGIAAVIGGLWLFLNAQGVGVPPFKDLWPVLLVFAGGASIADYLYLSRQPRSAGVAVAWIGFGVLFFALTLGYTSMGKWLDWLPSFPMILGLAMAVTWLADQRRNDNLVIAAGVLVVLGLLGFASRFDWLLRILPSAQVVWALLLLGGGGYLVWRTISKARG